MYLYIAKDKKFDIFCNNVIKTQLDEAFFILNAYDICFLIDKIKNLNDNNCIVKKVSLL